MSSTYQIRYRAACDIDAIADYIYEDSPQSALDFYDEVNTTCSMLGDMPRMGQKIALHHRNYYMYPAGRFKNYLIFYVIEDDIPAIVRIIHRRRDIESIFSE